MSAQAAHAKLTAICNALALTDGWFSEIAKRNGVTDELVRALVFEAGATVCVECIGSGRAEGQECKHCAGQGWRKRGEAM